MNFDFNGPHKECARISRNILDSYTNSQQIIEKSKVISETRSGKPIYSAPLDKQYDLYADYNADEHQDIIDYYKTTVSAINVYDQKDKYSDEYQDTVAYHMNEVEKKKKKY